MTTGFSGASGSRPNFTRNFSPRCHKNGPSRGFFKLELGKRCVVKRAVVLADLPRICGQELAAARLHVFLRYSERGGTLVLSSDFIASVTN